MTTVRCDNVPALDVKRIVPPAALPPDCPGFSVTERFNWVPLRPCWLSPVLANDAGGFPTRIHPPCCCATPALSVLGTEKW